MAQTDSPHGPTGAPSASTEAAVTHPTGQLSSDCQQSVTLDKPWAVGPAVHAANPESHPSPATETEALSEVQDGFPSRLHPKTAAEPAAKYLTPVTLPVCRRVQTLLLAHTG